MSKTVEQLREELIQALCCHDWYYDRSDDPRSYQAGNASYYRIRALVKQVPDGEALYEQYHPKLSGSI